MSDLAALHAETIGSYVIERALARGSMGHVYVAHHALTHARVALKVLRADVASDEETQERFVREVRAAAHIGHEGIVQVYDAGKTSDGRMFLAMELLEGETLEARLLRLPGDRLTTMTWLLAVLDPLTAAHAHGIVHRDLKPANVFIARTGQGAERVKLLDFGLARDMREKSVTATGIALGTPYYMSPEQASQPRDVGTQSDVWAMGVMMYEVLCGAMPFDGETLHAVVIRSSVVPHVPAAQCTPGLHPELAALVDHCLEKDPQKRPSDASAVRESLRALLANPDVRAELERPVAIKPRKHLTSSREDEAAMPFAETAISVSPIIAATQLQSRTGSWLALLLSTVIALGVASAGFFWLTRRDVSTRVDGGPWLWSDSEPVPVARSIEAERKPRKPARRLEATGAKVATGSRAGSSVELLPPPEPQRVDAGVHAALVDPVVDAGHKALLDAGLPPDPEPKP